MGETCMENRNMIFGVIGLLILVVIGLGIDRANQFTTLTEQANLAETAVAEAQVISHNLATTLEAQTGDLDAQTDNIEALSAQMAISSTEFESQIAELSDASTVLEENNEGFATQVADLSSQVDDLSGQKDGLQSDLDEASANADGLQTQLDEMTTENADAIATLEAENQALQAQVEALMPTATPSPEPAIEVETSAPDSADLEFVFQLDIDNKDAVQISPDNLSIAILRADNVIELVSAVDGTSQRETFFAKGDLSEFIYADNGRAMAAIMDNSTVIVFDSATAADIFEQEFDNPIQGYDLSSDSNAIAVGTRSRLEIKVFDSVEQSRPDGITSLDWSDDDTQIVISNGRSVSILDMEDYAISGTTDLDADGASVVDATFSPDGSHIVGVSVNQDLLVWSVESGEIIWQTSVDAEAINDIAWSSDSAYFAMVADGDVSIYGLDGSWVAQVTIDGVTSVDWSSDGAFLAFASAEQVSVVESASLLD
jgi:predicted  nucleic acid-binding Zn-ribbon protein